MHNEINLENQIFKVVQEILSDPDGELSRASRFVKDLRIDSDDLSFILCPILEDIAGCQIPFREWDNIYTIGDAIDLVKNHRDNHQFSGD